MSRIRCLNVKFSSIRNSDAMISNRSPSCVEKRIPPCHSYASEVERTAHRISDSGTVPDRVGHQPGPACLPDPDSAGTGTWRRDPPPYGVQVEPGHRWAGLQGLCPGHPLILCHLARQQPKVRFVGRPQGPRQPNVSPVSQRSSGCDALGKRISGGMTIIATGRPHQIDRPLSIFSCHSRLLVRGCIRIGQRIFTTHKPERTRTARTTFLPIIFISVLSR